MFIEAGALFGAEESGEKKRDLRGMEEVKIQVKGLERTFFLYTPKGHDAQKKSPLVIYLHGARGRGYGLFLHLPEFKTVADKEDVFIIGAQGETGDHTWNSSFGTVPGGEGILSEDYDDVAYIRSLVEYMAASHHIDPARVFVFGISAGAHMSFRAAVELSDIIAAAGPVCGSLCIKSNESIPVKVEIPVPSSPVSVIQICGKNDKIVKIEGGQYPKVLEKSAKDCALFFINANGCAAAPQKNVDATHGITRTLYSGGKNGVEVKQVILDKAGHEFPSLQKRGMSTVEELWDFFSKHPKGAK